MSYAAPFSLLSFHLPDRADSAEERLTWPLAGSLVIHAAVLIAFVSLRFASSLEQSSGSYEVTLVTLQEISASSTASPENTSRPERNVDKVPPPKAEAGKAPKAAPPRKAVSSPSPVPQEKSRVPERVTDLPVSALASVAVSKPQAPPLPQKAVPLPPPPLPVSADPKPTPKQNADKLPPPLKVEAREAPKAAPPRKAVSSPSPVPQEKPRVPELVTDSLLGALDSVVVPKLQALALPPKTAPVPAQAPPPTRQSPALEMDVQPIQAPPPPPKLDSDVVPKKQAPSVDPLARTLKQAVGTIDVPKKPKQASSRVSPMIISDDEQKQDPTRTPRSSGITLPAQAPRLADVPPPAQEAPKKETPLQTARKSSTVESLTQAIQSVRIPESIPKSKTPQPVSEADPLVPETSPKHPRAAEARNLPQKKFVSPQAPQLAKVSVEQDPVPSQPMVPMTTSEPDTLGSQIDKLLIPQAFDAQPGFQQTESGTQEMLDLRVAGSSPKENVYWGRVMAMIDKRWIVHRVEVQHRKPLQVVLKFRVERNGEVTESNVIQSSGNEYFDSTAQRALVAATPLPSFPKNLPNLFYDVQYTFTGPPNR